MFRLMCRVLVAGFLVLIAATGSGAELKSWAGAPLPAFELKDLEGRAYRLDDYRGKVVLVNFWATWCEPCRDEMPAIERLQRKFAGRPFAVLAVNVGEPEARIRTFLSRMKFDIPVLLDPGMGVTRRWQARILPASFLIGRDGRIRYTVVGELDWSNEHTVEAVSELIGVP